MLWARFDLWRHLRRRAYLAGEHSSQMHICATENWHLYSAVSGAWPQSEFRNPLTWSLTFRDINISVLNVSGIHANLAILATPVCVIGHQVYVLDPRWRSSLLDKLDISC